MQRYYRCKNCGHVMIMYNGQSYHIAILKGQKSLVILCKGYNTDNVCTYNCVKPEKTDEPTIRIRSYGYMKVAGEKHKLQNFSDKINWLATIFSEDKRFVSKLRDVQQRVEQYKKSL